MGGGGGGRNSTLHAPRQSWEKLLIFRVSEVKLLFAKIVPSMFGPLRFAFIHIGQEDSVHV